MGNSAIYVFLLPFCVAYLLILLNFIEEIERGKKHKVDLRPSKKNLFKIRDAALVVSALDIAAIFNGMDSYIGYGDDIFPFAMYSEGYFLGPILLLIFHVSIFILAVKSDIDGKLARKLSFSGRSGLKYLIIDNVINMYMLIFIVITNAITMRYFYGVLQ